MNAGLQEPHLATRDLTVVDGSFQPKRVRGRHGRPSVKANWRCIEVWVFNDVEAIAKGDPHCCNLDARSDFGIRRKRGDAQLQMAHVSNFNVRQAPMAVAVNCSSLPIW